MFFGRRIQRYLSGVKTKSSSPSLPQGWFLPVRRPNLNIPVRGIILLWRYACRCSVGTAPESYRLTPAIQKRVELLRDYRKREYVTQPSINRIGLHRRNYRTLSKKINNKSLSVTFCASKTQMEGGVGFAEQPRDSTVDTKRLHSSVLR